MVKISKDVFIEREKIAFIGDYKCYSIKRKVKEQKIINKVISVTHHKVTNCAVFLESGIIFLTNASLQTMQERIDNDKQNKSVDDSSL